MRYLQIMLLFAVLALTGCVTSTVRHIKAQPGEISSSGRRAVAHLEGMNSGVYLFYYIPIYSGKPGYPNRREYDTFRNNLEPKHMKIMLNKYASRLKADAVEDLKITSASSGIWTLGILWKRSIHGTATAVKTKK